MASVTELLGRVRVAETFKFVVVTLVVEIFVGVKLVVARLEKKPLVEVMEAPTAVRKLTFDKKDILFTKVVVAPPVELTVRAPSEETVRDVKFVELYASNKDDVPMVMAVEVVRVVVRGG